MKFALEKVIRHFDNQPTHAWLVKQTLTALLRCVARLVYDTSWAPFQKQTSKLGKHDLERNPPESRLLFSMVIGMVALTTLSFRLIDQHPP